MTTKKEMTAEQKQINFLYFLYNGNMKEAIKGAFKNDENLTNHFLGKFSNRVEQKKCGFVRPDAITDFLMDLTHSNKEMLLNWITLNYRGIEI